jgi:glycosyltransferase involved in cell wall biosynthesis
MQNENLRLGILQRVLTDYRAPFFDLLSEKFPAGVSVAAGTARQKEQIVHGEPKMAEFYFLKNLHLFHGKRYLCWQDGVINWLKSWQPDVLIVEANPRYLSTPGAVRWMRRYNRPVIGWGLGAGNAGGFLSVLRKNFLDQFDALLTYSQKGKAQYVASGIMPERIFVAPNAASFSPTDEMVQRRSHFRDGRGKILFVGRLQARKRVDLLLHACAALPENIQPDLTIVGDGTEMKPLQTLAVKVYPSAVFTGDQRGEDLHAFFKRADIFVLPGTGGLALQQALSFGLPAIVAEGDGTQEDLVRKENGWTVEPGSLESLRNALQNALQSPEELRKKGIESFRIVREEINLNRMADGFEDAIHYAVGKNRL